MFQMMAVLSISTCQAVQSLSANWCELPHEKMSSEKHRVIYNIQQISEKKEEGDPAGKSHRGKSDVGDTPGK